MLAPPNESTSPRVAIPTRVYSRASCLPARVTMSPSSKPPFSAAALSITTSSSAWGGPPSGYSSGSKRGWVVEKANVGAPPPPMRSPSESMIATCGSVMPPSAASTPSTPRTVSSKLASTGGSDWSSVSTCWSEVTTASTPWFDSVKMSSNDCSIVSVST